MSKFFNFYQYAMSDPFLAARLEEIGKQIFKAGGREEKEVVFNELLEMARQEGFIILKEELIPLLNNVECELTEQELLRVAGGVASAAVDWINLFIMGYCS